MTPLVDRVTDFTTVTVFTPLARWQALPQRVKELVRVYAHNVRYDYAAGGYIIQIARYRLAELEEAASEPQGD